jgi:hypothetical protein
MRVAAAHPDLHLTIAPDLQPSEQLFLRSDHFNFAKIDVPALFLTTGLHEDYHRPSDEVAAIDADKIARVARLAFLIGAAVADAETRPAWTATGRAVMRATGFIGQ